MKYQVFLTNAAACDLEELYHHIQVHDSVKKAEYVLDKIEKIIETLFRIPQRGVYPQELADLGIRDYREIFFKPYRLIYRVIDHRVYIYMIVDGRRDMQALLARRLLA
ncbi:type II toxin-antitoxin system RelE/ParE family toxin [bacterium]|nr:type II toxin-antitoxin system RelE/ParE family toxin [bacterium]